LNLLQPILSIGQFLTLVYWGTSRWLGVLEALLSIVGIWVAFRRRSLPDRLLLIWIATSFIVFAGLFSQRFVNYYTLWSPLLILLGVTAIQVLSKRIANKLQQPALVQTVTVLAGVGLVAANLTGNIWVTRNSYTNNFSNMGQSLLEIVPADTRVIADPNWWWVLRNDHVFITDEYFLYPLPPFNPPPATIQDGIQYLRPDYILIDSATSCINRDGPGHAELLAYAISNCTLVTNLDGAWVNDPGLRTNLLGQTTSIYRCTAP
jgi:hypothetical protein